MDEHLAEWWEGFHLWMATEHPGVLDKLDALDDEISSLQEERTALFTSLPREVRQALGGFGSVSDKPWAYLEAKRQNRPVSEILQERRAATTPAKSRGTP